MKLTDSLKKTLIDQKKLLSSMEKEIDDLDANNVITENQNLKQELNQVNEQFKQEKNTRQLLSNENEELNNALYEQIYNEKMTLLRAVNQRSEIYFASKTEGELNRLKAFEARAKRKINAMTETLKGNRVSAENEIFSELESLSSKINQLVTLAQSDYTTSSGAFTKQQKEDFSTLEQEKLSERELKSALKKNNLESLIGLNIMSKLGILFLIIAVIALSRYGYVLLTPLLKGIVIFAIGGLLLCLGEWLNQKLATVFSIALTGGGIAILYVATSLSYLTLNILSIEISLLLCVVITILAFTLSLRYSAQTITIFALIGGYLPVVTITDPKMSPLIIMGYFFLLNLFLLLISTRKKWLASTTVGFILNVAASIFIINVVLDARMPGSGFALKDLSLLLYLIFVFFIYTLIPVVSVYYKKAHFSLHEIILIGANTFISAVLINITFVELNLKPYLGLLAVLFALTYFAFGWWMYKNMPKEKTMTRLFNLTGFAFVILFIPYQFGEMWLSLGWLVEGVILATYGILKEDKGIKIGGIVVCLLSLYIFLFFDVSKQFFGMFPGDLFTFKYLSVTLGSIILLIALAIKKTFHDGSAKVFKYLTVINVWFFTLYIVYTDLETFLLKAMKTSQFDPSYLLASIAIVLTFLLAYVIQRVKILADTAMKIISGALYIIGIIWLFILNTSQSPAPLVGSSIPPAIMFTGTFLLILLSLISVAALRELVHALVLEHFIKHEFYPIIISAYFVVILTQSLITQYGLEFSSLVISLIYIVTALLWILYGFVKRTATVRRFGLGLSMLAIAKLIFLDLSGLNSLYRIISYFAFGVFLLAISLVYQHFNKRLELINKVEPKDKQIT
jgi:uncharacterized membrane protein